MNAGIGALDVGLEALAKALQCNGSIKELDICGNHPGPVAVEALIKMLEENDSLLDVNSGLFDNERQYSNIFRPRPAMSEELAERYRKFQCIAEKRTLQNKVLRHVTVPLLLSNSVYLGGAPSLRSLQCARFLPRDLRLFTKSASGSFIKSVLCECRVTNPAGSDATRYQRLSLQQRCIARPVVNIDTACEIHPCCHGARRLS